MHIQKCILFHLALSATSFAFYVPHHGRFGNVVLSMSSEGEAPKKKLTAADIIARARRAVGAPEEEEEAEKLFEDSIMDDMQATLLTLEKRVKGGPGCITCDEITEMEAATTRIIDEMNENQGASSSNNPPEPARTASVDSIGTSAPTESFTPTSDEEGEAYSGAGGLGLAKGTANTWLLDGMDDMSPEEYRAALQKNVIERQSGRKGSREGVVGNRAALQYLDQLGDGGAADNWRIEDTDDSAAQKVPGNILESTQQFSHSPNPAPLTQRSSYPTVPLTATPHNHVPSSYEQPNHSEAHALVDKIVSPETSAPTESFTPTSDEEGEAYSGAGGLGLAKGTANTWLLDGMDNMSPEEYRAALQKNVIERQSGRKGSREGVVGNRAALQYLDQLGDGGAADNWKTNS